LAALTKNIALVTIRHLLSDVNNEITTTTTALDNCAQTLAGELDAAKTASTQSSLLSLEEKEKLETWWDFLINFNNRMFTFHVTKCRMHHTVSYNGRPNILLYEALDSLAAYCKMIFVDKFRPIDLGFLPREETNTTEGQLQSSPQPAKMKESPSKRHRQKRRPKQKTKEGEEGTSESRSGQAEPAGTKQKQVASPTKKSWEKKKQKVFVNIYTKDKNITVPSYVYRTLNLDANFSIATIPTQKTIWSQWQESRKQILTAIEKGKEQGKIDSRCSFINNFCNAMNDQALVPNSNYINKSINNKALRRVANVNLSLKRVYEFMTNNDLLVILADKNLGLTIVNKDWYHEHMCKHFDNIEAFDEIDVTNPPRHTARIIDGKLDWLPLFHRLETRLKTICRQRFQVGQYENLYFHNRASPILALFSQKSGVFPQPYGLIKLHKQPPKLRYITPVVG